MPPKRVPICFLLTVKDEEANLPYSLASIVDWAAEVWVVDSGSTDRTQEIAERFGAKFVFHAWQGYAAQKNWSVDNLPIESPWIFILDADESITPELRRELTRTATADVCVENGFFVNRFFIFLNKRIRHCGYYPSWNIRFFRKGKARYEKRDVHEHMIVDGKTGFLQGDMEHNDRRGMEYYFAKHNQYSTLEAREMYRILTNPLEKPTESFWSPPGRRRWIKTYIWPKLPARWIWRWVYMYILRLGILDGYVGFHFCLFLASYEHQISLKLREMQRTAKEGPPIPAPQPTETSSSA